MTGKTIDQLPSAGALTGTEEIPVWQGTATVKLTIGSAVTHPASDFDSSGAAAAAQTAAEAYADAGDAPTVDANLQTTNATANQVVATYTPPHNSFVHVEGSFLAFFNSKTDAKYHKVTAAFITDNSGVVTMAGSSQGGDTKTTAGASACASDLITNGSVVQFVVTGIALTTINWRVLGDVEEGP